ncbi:AAA family ATPase [Limnoraphis robusta]|uniref:AAA family ATPase n=1 Tax=Limnoraphis robusta CCNP1315 TaxID=3110306 RepID=A0ABU5TXS4_9CYAN|nr:AAA family ATPase [Limnoraphis robusta]MEA5519441.1 AAA family ATPase [Limnoraphis robusta CCNP1315]MEA5544223.1 AAA family ATPase [Limnoraphis robusta CCNP1324]
MKVEEALAILERTLPPGSLNTVKTLVFRQSWEGKGYADIAEDAGYDPDYIKGVAAGLWHSLSEVLGQKVTKKNFRSLLIQRYSSTVEAMPATALPSLAPIPHESYLSPSRSFEDNRSSPLQNRWEWGEAPDVSVFYGRTAELAQLQEYIQTASVRLLAVMGMGGMGKTALVVKLVEQLKSEFDVVIWRSLRYAPAPETVLTQLLSFLSPSSSETTTTLTPATTASTGSTSLSEMGELIRLCRTYRCLIVLDNVETILEEGTTGRYRPGYEGYGELFRVMGETVHQSCLLLTSREKPPEIAAFEGTGQAVRSFLLEGSPDAAIALLDPLYGSPEQKKCLCELYSYSPLALKIVSSSIQDLFEGEITQFLEHRSVIFNGIRRLLDPQFQRLSALEMTIMFWLAIDRGQTTVKQLHRDLIPPVSQASILQALESLSWRSLVKREGRKRADTSKKKTEENYYIIEPMVMEYLTHCLTEEIVHELTTGEIKQFFTHTLIKTTVDRSVREHQRASILEPIARALQMTFSSSRALLEQLQTILERLRQMEKQGSGYGVGNWLNLCVRLQIDLSGYDFSHLTVWHADLQQVNLHHCNFAYANLSHSIFATNGGEMTALDFSQDNTELATGNIWGEIRLWSLRSGSQQRLISPSHRGAVTAVAWSRDQQTLASSSQDGTIRLWDVQTGHCRQVWSGHHGGVNALAWSPLGQMLATCGEDGMIRLWDVRRGTVYTEIEVKSQVNAIAFSSNGILASGNQDSTIELWDVNTGDCLRSCRGHQGGVSCAIFASVHSPWEGLEMATSPNGTALFATEGLSDEVNSLKQLEVAPILVSASRDCTLKLWDISTGSCLQTWRGHTHGIESIANSLDEPILASGSEDGTVKLWNRHTGQCLKTLHHTPDPIRALAFSPNGQILAIGTGEGTIQLWNVQTGQYQETLRASGAYEQMNITGVTGLTVEQINRIVALGALTSSAD